MYKKILLVSSSEEITLPYGSKINTLTFRDPKPLKVLKYLYHMNISSVLTTVLEEDKVQKNSFIVLFNESDLEINEVLDFCQKNECDLLILKNEDITFSKNYDFKIIHSPSLVSYIEIYDKIISEIKTH